MCWFCLNIHLSSLNSQKGQTLKLETSLNNIIPQYHVDILHLHYAIIRLRLVDFYVSKPTEDNEAKSINKSLMCKTYYLFGAGLFVIPRNKLMSLLCGHIYSTNCIYKECSNAAYHLHIKNKITNKKFIKSKIVLSNSLYDTTWLDAFKVESCLCSKLRDVFATIVFADSK